MPLADRTKRLSFIWMKFGFVGLVRDIFYSSHPLFRIFSCLKAFLAAMISCSYTRCAA